MKEEALKLADELEGYYWGDGDEELTPSMLIRRLVEELDKPHPKCDKSCMYLCQTKPLSDEEMMKVIEQVACSYDPYEVEMSYDYEIRLAKAIEERHGIK